MAMVADFCAALATYPRRQRNRRWRDADDADGRQDVSSLSGPAGTFRPLADENGANDGGDRVFAVKVEVHSSNSSSGASGSDENLSSASSDRGSERGAGTGENDYEDIYEVRHRAAVKGSKSPSRDSGSHSRSGSMSSTGSGGAGPAGSGSAVVVLHTTGAGGPAVTNVSDAVADVADAITNVTVQGASDRHRGSSDDDAHHAVQCYDAVGILTPESGVSSGSPSDASHSAEDSDPETSKYHHHTLPGHHNHHHLQHHHHHKERAPLKRVVSEPATGSCPPPPPPPLPPATDFRQVYVYVQHPDRNQSDQTVAVAGGDGGATAVGAAQPSFVPPKFPAVGAHHEDGSLIKPSEYLRSIVGSCGGGTGPETTAVPAESATGGAAADHHQHHHRTPPPPPPPLLHRTKSELSVAAAVGQHQHQKQPLAAISIQDLHSVQLKKTPGTVRIAGAMNCGVAAKQPGDVPPLQAQRQDLIAELKLSKDINGIKKLKVEKVKMNEMSEKQKIDEIAKQLSPDNIIDQIPEKDANGNLIPAWKRQMMAKKAAEKARKDMEEELSRQAEEKRLQALPPWKRQLMQNKKQDDKSTAVPVQVKPSSNVKVTFSESREPAVVADGDGQNKENDQPATPDESVEEKPAEQPSQPPPPQQQSVDDAEAKIIPWRAQLRKTNSTLNLLE